MTETILIVDDDKDLREEFKYSFNEYRIIEAFDGRSALNALKKANDIGVVILDVMMPDTSGIEVLREIKKNAPDVGIVILTGYSSKDIAIQALKAHADDYLEKPLDIARAREVIERLLEKRRGQMPAAELDAKGKMERIKLFTQRNISRNVKLKDASSVVFLSPKYLSRVFKQRTGMGFARYKLNIKLRQARELLEKTGLNINQIAEKTGYSNAESFTRIFKKYLGVSPTVYRAKTKRRHRR